ncbi:hypothetical protein PAXRUDRAFT_251797 [Paxillus rubicundulus Ve08.2h10]|uniref:Uncharacterized protein n=1 Tax=Paxillus rubicundulus Ve08.2h10 TaxID=930991 RepID=A0A0D0CWV9_9AGAM|nr:hypothetical protein PAXRUDRAFT_251797 [Paxillus rubicundulus Ve08.2h10]
MHSNLAVCHILVCRVLFRIPATVLTCLRIMGNDSEIESTRCWPVSTAGRVIIVELIISN